MTLIQLIDGPHLSSKRWSSPAFIHAHPLPNSSFPPFSRLVSRDSSWLASPSIYTCHSAALVLNCLSLSLPEGTYLIHHCSLSIEDNVYHDMSLMTYDWISECVNEWMDKLRSDCERYGVGSNRLGKAWWTIRFGPKTVTVDVETSELCSLTESSESVTLLWSLPTFSTLPTMLTLNQEWTQINE